MSGISGGEGWRTSCRTSHILMRRTAISLSINRDRMSGWTMWGVTGGVSVEQWSAEFFIDNLTDERAELARSFGFDRQRVTYARPFTAGMRLRYDF